MPRSLYYVGDRNRERLAFHFANPEGRSEGPRYSMPRYPPRYSYDQFDPEDESRTCDDASVSSRSTRSAIQSDELNFVDDGVWMRPGEEQKAELPPAVTLEDLIDIRQSRTSHSITSSMDVMNLRIAERADPEESRKQLYEYMTTGYLGRAEWFGIPPLHYQTELSIPYAMDGAPDEDRTSPVADEPLCRRCSIRRCAIKQPLTRKAEIVLKEMPTHLLPFVPYIEKRIDETIDDKPAPRAKTMNVGIIRAWLDGCDKRHAPACYSSDNSQPRMEHGGLPLYLIDVKDGCIVPTPRHSRYVALSYVWGRREASTCATTATLQELQKPEGLYRRNTSLPRTITDAVHLVDSLGERYLWIDRLCIVQDEEATKQQQLSSVGEIYAGAFFTLVEKADSSSAATGIYATLTGLKLTPWPDMLRYTRLTSLFNERDLTFPEDFLNAFAGCLHHLSRVFPGGFVSGLPAMCFDASLL
jgi:hypothetical protein